MACLSSQKTYSVIVSVWTLVTVCGRLVSSRHMVTAHTTSTARHRQGPQRRAQADCAESTCPLSSSLMFKPATRRYTLVATVQNSPAICTAAGRWRLRALKTLSSQHPEFTAPCWLGGSHCTRRQGSKAHGINSIVQSWMGMGFCELEISGG